MRGFKRLIMTRKVQKDGKEKRESSKSKKRYRDEEESSKASKKRKTNACGWSRRRARSMRSMRSLKTRRRKGWRKIKIVFLKTSRRMKKLMKTTRRKRLMKTRRKRMIKAFASKSTCKVENLKSLYICISPSCGGDPILIRSDVHNGVFYRGLKSDFPTHLLNCEHYGVVSFKSDLYFVGGYKLDLDNLAGLVLDNVSVFNLDSYSWINAPSMRKKRVSPVVLVYQNNIYAFGSNLYTSLDPDPDTFAELYDLGTQSWSYFPCNPPHDILLPENTIFSHSFDEAKGVVYFWFGSIGVYSYHFESGSWALLKVSGSGPVWTFDYRIGLRWSLSTVFFDSFIIWHYFGTIYAYSCSDHSILTLFTFKNSSHKFSTPIDFSHHPSPSYLINVGDNKLCLVYGSQHHKDSETIRCYTFDIKYSHTSADAIKLTRTGRKVFHCEGYRISTVFTGDRDTDGSHEVDVQLEPKKEITRPRPTPFECSAANLMGEDGYTEKVMALQELYPDICSWGYWVTNFARSRRMAQRIIYLM